MGLDTHNKPKDYYNNSANYIYIHPYVLISCANSTLHLIHGYSLSDRFIYICNIPDRGLVTGIHDVYYNNFVLNSEANLNHNSFNYNKTAIHNQENT
ncbi:hypothetical protein ANCCEY_10385 [Ancylostoma ceylanicum]|uniref:Uncharacterized protein n=1 Tax=Ancylostoma ceylanicum TaxID=53326 RepID=A0A0D6LSA8_9BILA|nr:hypothetical protein ANCCEY_10385 [Ancylostoma ceylanicum]